MVYRGACHCGAVRAEFLTATFPRLRMDGCSFCTSRGVKSASDHNGSLHLQSNVRLHRYRFGHRTADFLICPLCGTYIGAMMEGPAGPVAVINVVGLWIPELRDAPADLASLDGETVEARRARRLSRWTPVTLVEPPSDPVTATPPK